MSTRIVQITGLRLFGNLNLNWLRVSCYNTAVVGVLIVRQIGECNGGSNLGRTTEGNKMSELRTADGAWLDRRPLVPTSLGQTSEHKDGLIRNASAKDSRLVELPKRRSHALPQLQNRRIPIRLLNDRSQHGQPIDVF